MAGLRVGYGVTTPEIAQLLEKSRMPFNCNRMGQLVAVAALKDCDFVEESKENYRAGIAKVSEACRELNIAYEPPHANFIMIKVGGCSYVTLF